MRLIRIAGRPFFALAVLAGALAAAPGGGDAADCAQKPGERLRARVVPGAELFAAGVEVRAELEVELLGAAESLLLRTEGSGVLAAPARDEVHAGPFAAGARESVALDVPPVLGDGAGTFRVAVTALDAFENPIYGRSVTLHALADERGTWVSGSSTVDLALGRLARLRAGGDLSADAYASAVEAASAAAGVTDHAYRGPVERTPAQELLDAAFGGAEDTEAAGQVLAGVAETSVAGTVLWTDRAGNTHPLPQAAVEVRQGPIVHATATTDSAGRYAATLGTDEALTVRVRVFARSAVADVKPDAAGAATYRVDSANAEIAAASTGTINVTIGNSTDADNGFEVHASLVMIGAYASTLAGSMPTTIDTRFPTTRHTSLFDSGDKQLHILQGDRHDWDVIHHEYGHYFMNVHGFVNSPGGAHSFNTNMAAQPGRDKDSGTRLAWGEGWPTFFGVAGQQRMGGKGLNVPGVGDTVYTDSEDVDPPLNIDLETRNGVGEDDELSVMTALWDLFDGPRDGVDQVTLSDTEMFQTFQSSDPTRMGAAWEALAAPLSPRDRTRVGAALGQANIAPEPTAPADNLEAPATPPTFEWTANGGGAPNPLDEFELVFYSSDFADELLSIPVGDVTSFTPTQDQWNTVREGGDVVRWVVEGKSNADPATPGGALDFYWSQARTIGGVGISFVVDDTGSMSEEIGAVRAALELYIDLLLATLPAGDEPPTIQLVTFKDSVTERIVSNDLEAVKTHVNGLSASGGGDCPEFGAQAIEFAGSTLSAGGIMLFATDASSQPGVDLGGVIGSLKAKGVRVHTILSGDCGGLGLLAGGTLPPDLLVSGPQAWTAGGVGAGTPSDHQKPGDDDPPQDPLDDPGQDPLDDHGDTPEAATPLVAGDEVGGRLGGADDEDWFSVALEAGKPYAIRTTTSSFADVQVFDTDGTTLLASDFASTLPRVLPFVPDADGTFFVSVEAFSAEYVLGVFEDPLVLLQSAQEVFSTISAETGGVFSVQDDVNFGNTTEYVASVFNVMAGTVQPTVIVANPNDLPQDATFSLSLTGNRTNWREGTSVEVLADGVTVSSVEVISSTELSARLTVAPDATAGFADVVVTTPLGEDTEEARGRDIVEVVDPVASATLLSVQPASVGRGDELNLTLFGAKTEWDETSTLDFGEGVVVDSLTFVSAQELEATVVVAEDAAIGFRTATVATEGKPDDVQSRAIFVFATDIGIAAIRQLSPSQAGRGAQAVVSVTAENTEFENGVTAADFGPGVEVLAVEVLDAFTANVTVQVGLDAQIGFRDVALTTEAETAVIVKAFFVDDFASVRALEAGRKQKVSESLTAGGVEVFEFEAEAGAVLERVFVVAFGDGSNGTVLPPDPRVSLLGPNGEVLESTLAVGAPADLADVELPEAGTYRLVIQDVGGAGGAYKGMVFLAEEPAL